MGFRGQEFAFDSPAAAVAGFIAHMAGCCRSTETVAIGKARGRILAESVLCDRNSPPFDHAAMDGYALRVADLHAAATAAKVRGEQSLDLAVVNESRIGCPPPTLPELHECESNQPKAMAGERDMTPGAVALRIATGAPIPTGDCGANAVIKREDVTEHTDGVVGRASQISISVEAAQHVKLGDHIRHCGENARAGDEAASTGNVLTSASLGVLAAVGCVRPRVFTKLRAVLITTGDEVVDPHEAPGAFQIRNSNAAALVAVIESYAWVEVVHSIHLRDDDDLPAALRRALQSPYDAEAIVLTGGVSMGHRDPVRAAIEQLGAEILFHGLPQRPGKPMLGAIFAPRERAPVPVFGLPGNPVSALVTCTRIVLPILAARAGARSTPTGLQPRLVQLAGDDRKRIGLWWHRPARLQACGDGVTRAELVGTRGSGDIISAAHSDGFVELSPATSPSVDNVSPSLVPFFSWSS